MDCKDIKELIKALDSSSLTFLEVEDKDFKIKMGKETKIEVVSSKPTSILQDTAISLEEVTPVSQLEKTITNEVKVEISEEVNNIEVVKSPIVGTFYGSPSPEADMFVKVGSKVKKGDTLCIIEAMKLMNEIVSETDGEIAEILVQNEDMVEYGQPLFKIKA